MPPPSVIPPSPTEPVSPKPVARPCRAARRVRAGGQPGPAQAVRPADVDLDARHVAQVEDDAAVDGAVAGAAVAAAADRELEAGLAGGVMTAATSVDDRRPGRWPRAGGRRRP